MNINLLSNNIVTVIAYGNSRKHHSLLLASKKLYRKTLRRWKRTLSIVILDAADKGPVSRFFRFVGMPYDAPMLKTTPPIITITLYVSFRWVEPLQSGHALLLISLSTWCEGRLNVGFVNSSVPTKLWKSMVSRKNIWMFSVLHRLTVMGRAHGWVGLIIFVTWQLHTFFFALHNSLVCVHLVAKAVEKLLN